MAEAFSSCYNRVKAKGANPLCFGEGIGKTGGNRRVDEILRVESVEKYYGGKGNVTKAVDGIGFTVYKGEYMGIMGASGSGKTTLLNCISTIDTVTAGKIIINGKDITKLPSNSFPAFAAKSWDLFFRISTCWIR